MKDPSNRTKVVLRHLPPAISRSALMDQIDGRFAGRYNWFAFRSGKNSQKGQQYSRAYIDFQIPEDVVEFAEYFNGHIFVNEKGGQCKALVEYAPSQRVPKAYVKKDGREGTIFKDPEYLEFLELLAKPVENLPSAEIQLERREAEKAGGPKETLVVTPLMDFVRQKRAAKSGSQRSINGKLGRRAGGASPSSSSPSSKRGSDKRKVPTPMYVLRDNTKSSSSKDKSAYMLVSRKEERQVEKSLGSASTSGSEVLDDEAVVGSNGTVPVASASVEIGKRRVLLLKGKERDASQQQGVTTSVRNTPGTTSKQNQRNEASGRIIRSILSNKDMRHGQSYMGASEQQTQALNLDREKRPPRPPNIRPILKDQITSMSAHSTVSDSDGKRSLDDKVAVNDLHGSVTISEKLDKRTRNKDRPDRGVWAPLRRSDGAHANDDTSGHTQFSSDSLDGSSISQHMGRVKDGDDEIGVHNSRAGRGSNSYDSPLTHEEIKHDLPNSNRSAEIKILGGGRANISSVENGSHRHVGRRGQAHGLKEADGSLNYSEVKPPSKRGGSAGYGSHERQVWVQKSGSGS